MKNNCFMKHMRLKMGVIFGILFFIPSFSHADYIINGGTVTVANNASITVDSLQLSHGSLIANNSEIILGSTWTRTGGSFTQGTSTVTFAGGGRMALSGSSTFYVLQALIDGSTLQFSAGTTFYVTNTMKLHDVYLRSSINNATWYLRLSGSNQDILNVDVKDSDASSGNTIQATNSTNSGNNTNWTFSLRDVGERYWIATTNANWNNTANWSYASGKTGGAQVPTSTHTVIFDGANNSQGTCNINTTVTVATLTIAGYTGQLKTQSYNLTVSSSFSQSSGMIVLGTSIFTLQGDFDRTGGSYSADNSTLSFTGSQNQNLTSGSTGFYHVQINKSGGTLSLVDSLDVKGNITLSGGTVDTSSRAITVAGNWSKSGGTYNGAGSTVTFEGPSSHTLTGSTTFYGLQNITNGTTLYFTAGTTQYVTNLLDLENIYLRSTTGDNFWYFSYSASSQTLLNIDIQDSNANAGTTLFPDNQSTDSGNNYNWSFGDKRYWIATSQGNWNTAANWSYASGGVGGAPVPTSTHTVVFDGRNNSNGTAIINGSVTVATLTVSGYTGVLNTVGSALTVTNLFSQSSGMVAIGTSIVTMQGDFTRTGGNFSTGISTIQFTGSNQQTLTSGATGFYHVVVNKAAQTVTLGDDLNLVGQLTITAGTLDTNSTSNYASSSTILNVQASGIFNANNSTITLTGTGGTLFTEAGAFNQGSSKVIFTPNAAVTLTSNNIINFYNLELSPTITTGRAYTFGTNPLNINGDLLINPTAGGSAALTVNIGSSTVVLGTTTVTSSGSATANLTTQATNRNFTSGRLDIQTGGTFTANASMVVLNGQSGPLLALNGGTFTPGTSTVDIESDADVTLTSGTITFNNFSMTSTMTASRIYTFGSGAITVNGSVTMAPVKTTAGNITLEVDLGNTLTVATAGTLIIGGVTNAYATLDTTASGYSISTGKINIQSNGTLKGNGSTITLTGTTSTLFTNTGSFIPSTSTVAMTPNAAVTLTSGFITFGNLTLSPTMTLARAYTFGTSSLTVSGNLLINPNAALAVALTVNLASTTVVAGTTTLMRSGLLATSNLTTTASNFPFSTGNLDLQTGGTLTGNASNIVLNGNTGPLLMMNGGTYTTGTSTLDIESDADVILTSGTVTLNNLLMTSTMTASHVYTFGSGALTINGSMTIAPLKSDAGDATLEVALGNSLTVAAAGTINIGGVTNAYTLLNTTNNNYSLSSGKINIQSNGTLKGNGSTITLTATTATLFTNSGSFIPDTSTVAMNPNATVNPVTSGFITFYNLSFTPANSGNRVYTMGSSSVTILGNWNINPAPTGNFSLTVNLASTTVVVGTTSITRSIAAGSSALTTTASNFPLATGNLNIATGGTFTANASNVTLTGATSPLITRSGTFTQGTSTVSVVTAGSPTLTAGTITFNHLYIDSTNQIVSLGAATTVSGLLTINSGTLNDAGNQLTGNATNKFFMQPDTEFIIGSAATATTFPTLFTAANINFAMGSTVTYNAGVAQAISGTPNYANLTLISPSGTPTKTPAAAISVRGDMTIGASNTYSNGALSLTIGGNYSNAGTFTAGSGSTTFNGSSSGNTLSGNLTGTSQFNNLAFNGLGDWTPTSSLTVGSTLTVTAGTLLGTNDITVNGGVIGNGTNGTITLTGGTFTQRVAANQWFGSNFAGSNDWTFNNLTFSNSSASNRTVTTSTNGTGGFIINGALTIGSGGDSNSTTLANSTSTGNRYIDVNSDLTISSQGILQASSQTVMNVAGNWTNSGTFSVLRTTVIFDGAGIQTLTGSTTFYGLRDTTTGGTIKFTSGSTTYCTNMVEFKNITLQSTTDNATWYFKYNGSSQTLVNLQVKDSNAALGSIMQASASTDNGNNTNWDFGAPGAVNDFLASLSSYGRTIDLTWSAPGDDAYSGTLFSSTFTIQYTTDTLFGQSSSWSPTSAAPAYVTRVHIATNNVTAGSVQSYSLTGLSDGATYFFRLWTRDNIGSYSNISNGATNYARTQILSISLSQNILSLTNPIDLNTTVIISTSILVTNDGNVPETFNFNATTSTVGSPWSIQPTQATDQFVLWAIVTSTSSTTPVTGDFGNEDRLDDTDLRCTASQLTNSGSTCVGVSPGEQRKIWFKLAMPTLTTTGVSQDIRITGTATVPD